MKKNKHSYNDGIVNFYKDKPEVTSFNSKKNVRSLNDLIFVKASFFSEETKRQQDMLFAAGMDRKLSYKIKTPLNPEIDNTLKAVIKGHLYSIITIDDDKDDQEQYIYLEEIREL